MLLFLCTLISAGLGQPNLPPYFTIDLDNIEVEENIALGSEVVTLQGEDPEGFPVSFSLEGTELFTVDGESGVVRAAGELDREQLAGGQCEGEVVFLAVITDQVEAGPHNVVKVPVSVTLTDLNDNPPQWRWEPYEASLYPALPVGTTIFTSLEARDPDQEGEALEAVCLPPDHGPNLCDHFLIIPSEENNPNMFRGSVRLRKSLPPHFNQTRYQMKVSVSDGTFSATSSIEFNLLTPPAPPVFPEQVSIIGVVKRDDAAGRVVMMVRAEDPEPSQPGEIKYQIVENPHGLFAMNTTTGALSLGRKLDRRALRDSSGVLTVRVEATKRTLLGLEGSSSTELSILYIEMEDTGPLSGSDLDQGQCYCGQKKNFVVQTIVGGDYAEVNEFPWSVFLNLSSSKTGQTAWCGGSLITDRHVLTAAHCLQQDTLQGDVLFLYDNITIILGDHDLSRRDETETFITRSVKREIEKHPKFHMRRGQGVIKYDVAILTLGQPVDFARFPHIRPVCLPSPEDLSLDLTNKTGTAIGWGLDSVIYQETTCDYTMGVPVQENKALPSQLKKIKLRFNSSQDCYDTFEELRMPGCPAPRIHTGVHLCASSLTGDICVGDSGGGLTALDTRKKNHVIFGISSFNLGCNSKTIEDVELPSVFTNVREREVMDWIRDETADGNYCERRTGNNPPRVEIRNLPDRRAQQSRVEESASRGQVVAFILVTDPDQGENGQTLVSITQGNEAGHFRLDSVGDIHVVRVAGRGLLDRQKTSQYQLTVVAEDRGTPPRTSTATLVINVKRTSKKRIRLVFPDKPEVTNDHVISTPRDEGLDKCGTLRCSRVVVTGASSPRCNGEYAVMTERASWAPDFPLYKHRRHNRYLYFLTGGFGWTIGTRTNSLHFLASRGKKKTCEPWEILWPDDITVTCKR